MSGLVNWAGNHQFRAARIRYPESIVQLQDVVARTPQIKALGSRHSFNDIADSPGDLISLARLPRVAELDRERCVITIDGASTYGQICKDLCREGFALPNMASLPHISVAGASATASHGSGDLNQTLAAAVSAMEIVAADGQLTRVSREANGDEFDGMVVGLGGLGVVTSLTLDLIQTFDVRQVVYENLPFGRMEENIDDITTAGYSVSLFTDWRTDAFNQVWLKRRVDDGPYCPPESTWFGATLATAPLHPLAALSAENCTPQMGHPGPWHERLPHFRVGFMPSSGDELQSEYFVPRRHAIDALRAVFGIRDRLIPMVQISEVRTIAADTLWMSPFYRRDSAAIHFTWIKDWPSVERALPILEEALKPFDARPHWGKLFTMLPDRLQSLYPRMADFRKLLSTYDPEGKFRNHFLDTHIFGSK